MLRIMETNEQKAKAYDEALERARDFYEFCKKSGTKNTAEIILNIFPELKESEDERIRKAIVLFFETQDESTTYSFIPKKDILAWLERRKGLEKQGEHKSNWIEDDDKNLLYVLVKLEPHITAGDFAGIQNWLKSIKDRLNN